MLNRKCQKNALISFFFVGKIDYKICYILVFTSTFYSKNYTFEFIWTASRCWHIMEALCIQYSLVQVCLMKFFVLNSKIRHNSDLFKFMALSIFPKIQYYKTNSGTFLLKKNQNLTTCDNPKICGYHKNFTSTHCNMLATLITHSVHVSVF